MIDFSQPEKLDHSQAKHNAHRFPLPEKYLDFIRKLRREQTDAESVLWYFLCHECKLAIELDGGHHNEPSKRSKDEARNTFMEKRGIRILRFWNHERAQIERRYYK